MNIIVNVINKYKIFSNDLDVDYGSGKNNKKDSIIGLMLLICAFLYSVSMMINNRKVLSTRIFFSYLVFITFTALLVGILGCLYYNPQNDISNKKKKTKLKALVIITTLLLFLEAIPVIIIVCIVNKFSEKFGIQIFTRNIHIVLLDLFICVLSYLLCVCNDKIYKLNMLNYVCFISVIYIISYIIRRLIYRINSFISYREKYEYLYKSRSALIYIINILTIFSGVTGLYISKFNNGEFSAIIIYYIMPIIIFAGLEQINLCIGQDKSERIKFIQILYEELIILYDISYKQIADFSCIKIKIKLNITPYIIENYKDYYFSKNKKKDKMLIEALDECKRILKKEYNVYIEEEKKNFEKDLTENIDRLAKCLTIIKK